MTSLREHIASRLRFNPQHPTEEDRQTVERMKGQLSALLAALDACSDELGRFFLTKGLLYRAHAGEALTANSPLRLMQILKSYERSLPQVHPTIECPEEPGPEQDAAIDQFIKAATSHVFVDEPEESVSKGQTTPDQEGQNEPKPLD